MRRRIHVAELIAGGALTLLASHAAASPFTITQIAHTTDGFATIIGVGDAFSTPSINGSGVLAFRGRIDRLRTVIATGSGGPLTILADAADPLFEDFIGAPSINDAGSVAFSATLDAGSRGVFIRGGGPGATVATSPGIIGGALINAGGVAAFNTSTGLSQIKAGDGLTLGNLANPALGIRAYATDPAINALGNGAFGGFLNGREAIYASSGDPDNPTVIATEGPCATSFFDTLGNPDLNDAGTLIFVATLCGGAGGGAALFTHSGGATVQLVNSITSGFSSFESNEANQSPLGPGINNAGHIAFTAGLDGGGEALFNGLDPIANRVIGTGDVLFGRQVIAVDFFRAISDNGQLAFRATFTDGSQGIYRADPAVSAVPEPAALLLLGGALAILLPRWRRQD